MFERSADADAILEMEPADRVPAFAQFQLTSVNALAGARYGKNPMESYASYEDAPDSETHTLAFCRHVRMAQNGQGKQITDVEDQERIATIMKHMELHSLLDIYGYQLCRGACRSKLAR